MQVVYNLSGGFAIIHAYIITISCDAFFYGFAYLLANMK